MTSDERSGEQPLSAELPARRPGLLARRRSFRAQAAIALVAGVAVLIVWRYWIHDSWRESLRGAGFFCVYVLFVLGVIEGRRRRNTPPS